MSRPRATVATTTSRLVASLFIALLVTTACVPTGERPRLVDDGLDPGLDEAALPGGVLECAQPGPPFEAFTATTVRVIGSSGDLPRCVLVADTFALRSQGLMQVTDLAGYDGMLFAFAGESTGTFWMGNTLIPLTIAHIASTGDVVSTVDMEPCPDAVDCPSYESAGPYRWALEVPLGELAEFGLVDGATFDPTTLPSAVE